MVHDRAAIDAARTTGKTCAIIRKQRRLRGWRAALDIENGIKDSQARAISVAGQLVSEHRSMSARDLFEGIPRGVVEANGELRTLEQQSMPRASFMRTAAVRQSQQLAYDRTKLFLGVTDGIIQPSTKIGHAQVMGGHLIGFGDDTHATTIAGNRSGKGRSAIVPTLIHYAGSTLITAEGRDG